MTEQTLAPRNFGWVLLELMGHRQRIGQACEEEIAGARLLRIDVMTADGDEPVTEYYGASAIYALRPISEEVARDHRARTDPRPVRPADYRPQITAQRRKEDDDDDFPI